MTDPALTVPSVLTMLAASGAAFGLAVLSAVAGFGGGVLLLPVFTVLFGLRLAVPMLTLTQMSSNGSRVWLNRCDLRWPLIGWFALGAVPCAVAGGLLLAHAPLAPLQWLLGAFLIGVVIWRRFQRRPRTPAEPAFAAVGAASGLGSALLGSVGPLTAPFFLAAGSDPRRLHRHRSRQRPHPAPHQDRDLRGREPAHQASAALRGRAHPCHTPWVCKKIIGRVSDRMFVLLVEIGLLAAGTLFLIGL